MGLLVLGAACVFAGTLIVAFSDSEKFDGYVYGFSLMGVGGPG